jgi:hypothetical protein
MGAAAASKINNAGSIPDIALSTLKFKVISNLYTARILSQLHLIHTGKLCG